MTENPKSARAMHGDVMSGRNSHGCERADSCVFDQACPFYTDGCAAIEAERNEDDDDDVIECGPIASWPTAERAGDLEREFSRLVGMLPRLARVPVYPGRWGAAASSAESIAAPARSRRWGRLRHPFWGQA